MEINMSIPFTTR